MWSFILVMEVCNVTPKKNATRNLELRWFGLIILDEAI